LRLEEEGGWGDDEERGEEGDSVGEKEVFGYVGCI